MRISDWSSDVCSSDLRARIAATPHTIRLAAILARSLVLMRNAQNDVIDEGFTITAPNGGARMNPAVRALNIISGPVLTYRHTLAPTATARATTGDVCTRTPPPRTNADGAHDHAVGRAAGQGRRR